MANLYSALFSPIHIGSLEIKNRIAMMPMGVFSPRLMGPNGAYTKDGADYYIERAKGGVGLLVTGLLPVGLYPKGQGPGDPGDGFQKYIEQQKYLASGIHHYGAKVVVQISALTGRVSERTRAERFASAGCQRFHCPGFLFSGRHHRRPSALRRR